MNRRRGSKHGVCSCLLIYAIVKAVVDSFDISHALHSFESIYLNFARVMVSSEFENTLLSILFLLLISTLPSMLFLPSISPTLPYHVLRIPPFLLFHAITVNLMKRKKTRVRLKKKPDADFTNGSREQPRQPILSSHFERKLLAFLVGSG